MLDSRSVETPPEAPRAPVRPVRPKIKELEVMVADVVRESPDTATLVLFTGNDSLDYRPGHFLTIKPHQFPALERFTRYFEDMKGKKEPARAYSLSSAPHEKHLAITVKEERYESGRTAYPPLLSPILVWRTPPGTRMRVTGFGGPYVLPPDIEDRTDHLVHVCAGSGTVPNMSIIKHALATRMKLRHTLICGNKTRRDVIFRRDLADLVAEHPDKLEVVHALSRQADADGRGARWFHGRVGEPLIRQVVPDPSVPEFFVCGPGISKWERLAAREEGREARPRFLESVRGALDAMGIPAKRVHYESYG